MRNGIGGLNVPVMPLWTSKWLESQEVESAAES